MPKGPVYNPRTRQWDLPDNRRSPRAERSESPTVSQALPPRPSVGVRQKGHWKAVTAGLLAYIIGVLCGVMLDQYDLSAIIDSVLG